MSLKNTLIRNSMQALLGTLAYLARRERYNRLTAAVTTGLARGVIKSKHIRPARDLVDLGRQWQKGFPSDKQVPIVDISDSTVVAEIHTPCPLRGSGDVQACYRMMQFDREVVKKAGGQFVVLHSQATPGKTYCTVAMRRAGANMADLIPAHQDQD